MVAVVVAAAAGVLAAVEVTVVVVAAAVLIGDVDWLLATGWLTGAGGGVAEARI